MAEKAVEQLIYELSLSKVELDELISSIVDNMGQEVENISTTTEYQDTNALINKAERRAKDINKSFLQLEAKADAYMEEMKTEEKELEEQVRQREAEVAASCQIIDDDSDDDVTIIDSTFEPRKRGAPSPVGGRRASVPPLKQKPLPPPPPLLTKEQMSSSAPKVEMLGASPPPLTMNIGGTVVPTADDGVPNMEHLRAALTNALNRQVAPSAAPQQLADSKLPSEIYVYPPPKVKILNFGNKEQTSKEGELAPKLLKLNVTTSASTSSASQSVLGTMPTVWKEITTGSKVLAKKFNDIWYSGVVTDVQKPENTKHPGEWKYRVKFDGKGLKVLSGHHIAYREPISCFLKVGTRVAALYRDDETSSGSSFYAGIVAEAPSIKNNKRFLVFFDDGYAQYCVAKELHKVYYQSENVWEDIHPDSQEFIKEYLKQYPERPMVRLMKDQVVKTEWNGRWWTAKVMEVDASLVKMYFQADKRTEWIYRGSTRLEPLFKALANAEAIKAAGSSKGRRLNMDPKGQKRPTVEYTRSGTEDEITKRAASTPTTTSSAPASKPPLKMPSVGGDKKRSVAKKSTGGSASKMMVSKPRPANIIEDEFGPSPDWEAPWLKHRRQPAQRSKSSESNVGAERYQASSISSNKQGWDMASVLQERLASAVEQVDDGEALGEHMDTLIDTKDKVRKKMVPHPCGPTCARDSEEERDKHKGKNPLLIPLLCGWERQICKMRPSGRKCVIYRAPCARRLRTLEELDKYLSLVDSHLVIDFFCYDPWLHVHTEFVPVKTFCDIKDLSYGKENVPISCVNGIDRQYPDYVEYSSQRIPSKGVKIEFDENFLQCCDCTDNCWDRSKCACQQLTVENTTWIGEKDPNAGYHYRRLREPVFTGVVECNSRCKCDYRCRNRVAQNGLSCRLQVFKTEKRGWGLRCLNDIPKGGFICIYAGQLLTDKGANDDGKQYGDEYLAELDFIEVVERQKEGYESDVRDPESEDDTNVPASLVGEDDDEDEDFHSNSAGDGVSSSDSDFEGGNSNKVEHKVHATRRQKIQESQSEKESKPLEKLVLKRDSADGQEWTTEKKTTEWMGKMEDSPIEIPSDNDEDDDDDDIDTKETKPMPIEDELPDLDVPPVKEEKKEQPRVKEEKVKKDEKVADGGNENKLMRRARKSTGGSRFKNLPNPKAHQSIPEKEEEEEVKQGTRALFHDGSSCYIMDAKSMGNIGRYLNHSCTPNVFVQNIFVDTHDVRFPWVAFFAGQYIRAGTELTWDYNYEVGSVPDKVLYCYCGSPMCRGRLL
ncbi:histone-lysine N-methyltransferase eggless-like isoform X2 [Pomacea canaliculata]|uniref:histone-lysine N-methyltransferase eggless-like isoform X2 n=1 Tax=Pomacea canaliculata TaxID=400727 RepID=UPI000D73E65D|nr:histone-lysine N-methyltransferase eggless-like isoform X2 [Pomacea canaliculata]